MNLTFDEGKLFYDLYAALLSFANQELNVSSKQFSNSTEYTSTPPEARVAVRDALFAHRELIDEFVKENPANLSTDPLAIVGAWKHAVVGKFYVYRHLTKYTVFLTSGGSPNKAYGVLGLADPLEEVIGPYLPRLIETVLLPFRDKIIYDGLASGYNITVGGGVKRMLNEEYKQAKKAFGIITSLPFESEEPKRTEEDEHEAVIVTYDRSGKPHEARIGGKRPRKAVAGRSTSPTEVQTILATLIEMTDSFCKEFLDDEYAELCRKLATALARKRPSPLFQGKLETWPVGSCEPSVGSTTWMIEARSRT